MNQELEHWLWRNPAYESDDLDTYMRELRAGRRPLDNAVLDELIASGERPIEPQVEFSGRRLRLEVKR